MLSTESDADRVERLLSAGHDEGRGSLAFDLALELANADADRASLIERLGIAIAGNVTRDAEIRLLRVTLAAAELALMNVSRRLARETAEVLDEDEQYFASEGWGAIATVQP